LASPGFRVVVANPDVRDVLSIHPQSGTLRKSLSHRM